VSTRKRINPDDYVLPDNLTEEQLAERLQDPLVRICNLYWIEDADGNEIKFTPNEAQCEVLHAVYIEGVKRIAIPKARQLGFSTLIAIIEFDEAHFCEPGRSVRCVIIDQTAPDAQAKLAKIKFAWERLPEELKDAAIISNKGMMEWANGSSIIAGLRARGKAVQVVHISEWGPIAHDDPKRSEEIITGVLQAASGDEALIFAESTHKGGKGGDWYELIKRSLETPEAYRTKRDFRVMFFPWYLEPRYTEAGDPRQIDAETREYFDGNPAKGIRGKERETGHAFTPGQRLFYFKKKQELGRKVYSEFPTTIEECWMAPIVGAIYGPDVDKARLAGRINPTVANHYEGFPVYSTFDIGAPINTNCWLWQVIGDRINYLECLRGGDDCNTPAEWAKRLKERPYSYGGHFLPHDGETLWARLLREAGLKGVVCLPRPADEWDNINDALTSFSRCFFNSKGCEWGLDSLEAFRSKEEPDGVTIRNVPVHDWASHASTAFGYTHQAIRAGLCVDRSAMPTKPRPPGGHRPEVRTGFASDRPRSFTVRR
jgi:hypothetical protein